MMTAKHGARWLCAGPWQETFARPEYDLNPTQSGLIGPFGSYGQKKSGNGFCRERGSRLKGLFAKRSQFGFSRDVMQIV
jgi:hypothetical protein